MELTVLKPSGSIGDPFVAMETKLGKAVFLFKDALAAAVNMFPPISDVDAVKPKHIWLASQQQLGIWETRKGNVDKPIHLPRALGHGATTIFRPRTWTISDSWVFFAQWALRTAERSVEEERRCQPVTWRVQTANTIKEAWKTRDLGRFILGV